MGFSASSYSALKIKPYEWILTPLTLGFAYSEHMLEHALALKEMQDVKSIAHAFLSFMLWHRSEPLIRTVREFLDKVHAFAQKT